MSAYRLMGEAFSSFFFERVLLEDVRLASAFRIDVETLRTAQRLVRDARKTLAHREQPSATESHLMRPLGALLGWNVAPETDVLATVHGEEHAGHALRSENGEIWARAFCAGPFDSFDAPPRGAHRRFALASVVDRVLEASGVPHALLFNRSELRIVRRAEGGVASAIAFDLDALAEWGPQSERAWRTLIGLLSAPSVQAPRVLDRVVEFGRKEMVGVGDRLGRQVAEAAAGLLRGFYAEPGNAELLPRAGDSAALDALFAETLRTLYRALFALFGEARGLLPIDLPLYRDNYALSSANEAPTLGFAARVRALFRLLRRGADLGGGERIAAFGGALFSEDAAPLVDHLQWSDASVKSAIEKLTRVESSRGAIPVSYRELDEERLGAIYEGLLELRLLVAERPMERVRVEGRELVLDPMMLSELGGYAQREPAAKLIDDQPSDDDPSEEPDGDEEELSAEVVANAPAAAAKRIRNVTLLEKIAAGEPYLASSSGRKETASYYTARDLVDFLVRETIDPKAANATPTQILALRVVDPAMGSGHFLIGAMRRLADHLVVAYRRIEDDADFDALPPAVQAVWEDEPTLLALCRQLVATHCLYGVDKNQFAVDLARVALWLATAASDHALSFLDHRLRCGDALLGLGLHQIGTLEGLTASKASSSGKGRSKNGATQFRLLSVEGTLVDEVALERAIDARLVATFAALRGLFAILDDEREPFERKRAAAEVVRGALRDLRTLHAARVGRLLLGDAHDAALLRAYAMFAKLHYLSNAERLALAPLVVAADREQAFSWELEFPDAFYRQREDGSVVRREDAGFDVVLGNPPWDKMKLEERAWYARYDPLIVDYQGRGADARIARVDASVATARPSYVSDSSAMSAYVTALASSGSYVWQSVKIDGKRTGGDPDTFKYFTERNWSLAQHGVVGIVIPAAFTSGDGTTGLRQMVLEHSTLRSLVVFENRRKLFPIDSRFKFATVIFEPGGTTEAVRAAFWQAETTVLRAGSQGPPLSVNIGDVRRLSPKRLAFLEVRSARDLAIAMQLSEHGVPLATLAGRSAAWFGSELHMSQDRKLFHERDALVRGGATRSGDVWVGAAGERYLPLREGRMVQAFDGNAKRYVSGAGRSAVWSENGFPKAPIEPHYWVRETDLEKKWNASGRKLYWCDVTGATNERTAMAALIEGSAVSGHTLAAMFFAAGDRETPALCAALFNSFVFDWYIRLSVAQHLSFNFVEPAPFLEAVPLPALAIVVARLSSPDATYCERADLRAELDAAVALGYGLGAEDLAHILSSFPLIDREEPVLPGESRSTITTDLVLAAYAKMTGIGDQTHAQRVTAARELGALGYVAEPLRKQLPRARRARVASDLTLIAGSA